MYSVIKSITSQIDHFDTMNVLFFLQWETFMTCLDIYLIILLMFRWYDFFHVSISHDVLIKY